MSSLHKVTIVRYVDRNGQRVPKGTAGARKIKEKSACWYGHYKAPVVGPDGNLAHDAAGNVVMKKVRSRALSEDKEVAQNMLAALVKEAEQIKAGVLAPRDLERRDRLAGTTLAELVQSYIDHLKTDKGGVSAKHLDERRRLLNAVLSGIGAHSLNDVTAERVKAFIKGLAKKDGEPASARTQDTYRLAVACFANWLVAEKMLPASPLAGLKPFSDRRTPKRRRRRALRPEELQRLLDAARARPLEAKRQRNRGPLKGQADAKLKPTSIAKYERIGRQRALLYKAAVLTGYRRGELAALLVADLDADATPYPTLSLPPERTKNGEAARIYLLPALARELLDWIKDTGRVPADSLFDVPAKVIREYKKDLKWANISYRDERDRTADFHALRKTGNVVLGRAGVPAKIRQLFMRHADIRLTTTEYDADDQYEMTRVVNAFEGLNLR
jgi:integrase